MVAMAALLLAAPACGGGSNSSPRGNDRWVTTENTTIDIDWDAVGKAYEKAEGPEDFETKVNEIYTGSEIISVAESIDVTSQVKSRTQASAVRAPATNGEPSPSSTSTRPRL